MAPTIPEDFGASAGTGASAGGSSWRVGGLVALALLGLALYLPRLGASGLWDPWEPRYAQSAQNMSDSGQWIVPVYRDDPRLNKPPLTYWLIAASQAVWGVHEAATRLPMALLAVLCAVALAAMFAAAGRRLEGLLAGGALLTSPQWALEAHFATPDIPLAAFLGLALAGALAAPSAVGRARGLWIGLALGGIAAAGLTDWPRGLLLPLWAVLGWGALELGWRGLALLAVVAGLYHTGQLTYSVTLNLASFGLAAAGAAWVLKVRGGVSWRAQLAGVALIVALVAPWFLAVWRAAPAEELSLFEYAHALNLGEPPGEHTGPYVYPLRVAVVGSTPWIAAAAVGLVAAVGRRRDRLAVSLAGAWIGVVLFFTLSEAQMGHFYGVTQPALAGLAGIGAAALLRKRDWRLGVLALATLGVAAAIVTADASRLLETATVKQTLYDLVDPLAPALIAMTVWAAILLVAILARREGLGLVALLPAAALAGWLGMHVVPALEAKKSVRSVWLTYLAQQPREGRVGLVGDFKDTTLYYGRDRTVRLETAAELEQFLSGPAEKFLITPPKVFQVLEGNQFPGHFEALSRVHPSQFLVRYVPPAP